MSGFIFSPSKKKRRLERDKRPLTRKNLVSNDTMGSSHESSARACNEPLVVNDTLSASVNLDDIISDYDETSSFKKSISSSLASLSKIIQSSQTFFTATEGAVSSFNQQQGGNKNDETGSFYSALQDGFSLNEDYEFENNCLNYNPSASAAGAATTSNNSHILWADSVEQTTEKDILMSPSHFQVYWSDLVYTIKPKITISSLWSNLEQRFSWNYSNAFANFVSCNNTQRRRYSVSEKKKQFSNKDEAVTIIQNISGSFMSGELTAVMGPSGAGKTSLLNFLSRRREEGYRGELYMNHDSSNRIKISTIPQSDHLPEYLTVRENLMFASRLKNADNPNCDHEKNIERVSSLLGLEECLNTRTKKISGGQHKRLAIAQELLSKPDILILDEPTSGLDSLTCYKTITVLKDLVHASAKKLIDPIAIVLTIHQPQQEVFHLFDKIYVMANHGITIYNGPPSRCVEFVERHTSVKLPNRHYNPASFLIELASGEYGIEPIKALEARVKFDFTVNRIIHRKSRAVSKSILNPSSSKNEDEKSHRSRSSSMNSAVDKLSNYGDELDVISDQSLNVKQATTLEDGSTNSKCSLYIDHKLTKGSSMNYGNFWLKTRILILRCWFSMLRDPKQMIGRILFHAALPIAMACIMGTEPGNANACPKFKAEYDLRDLVYGESALNKDVQEELFLTLENGGLLFIIIYALTCANIAATTLSFTLDMQSSMKEYYNGWYSMPAYLLARIISTLPLEMILPLITMSITYPVTGQRTGDGLAVSYRVLLSSMGIILTSLIGQTMGMIVGALYIGHVTTALFASQAVTLPMAFLSGFVVRTKNMSKFVYALSKFSIYKHCLDIATTARYGFGVCNCNPEEINGRDAKIVGIPDRFNQFVKYWTNSLEDTSAETTTNYATTIVANETSLTAPAEDENKIFKLFAKQVSLYNTYGLSVKSCNDVKPYQLNELGLSETDIPNAFLALITLLLVIKIILFVTVKLVVHFRTSL